MHKSCQMNLAVKCGSVLRLNLIKYLKSLGIIIIDDPTSNKILLVKSTTIDCT